MTTPHDSAPATRAHIAQVADLLRLVCAALEARAADHDASKLLPPEKATFDEVTPQLAGLTFGSDAYKTALASMGPALDHHYAMNRHHPEHFPDGVASMTLVDLVEMVCDWVAASRRHNDGDPRKSVRINADRFNIPPTLAFILEHTVHDLVRPFERGRADAAQDCCENVPFASIGGLDHRLDMVPPAYIAPTDWPEYRRGYEAAMDRLYGVEWRENARSEE